MNRVVLLCCVISVALVGCVMGQVNTIPASAPASYENSVVINKKRADVWATGVPRLAKEFFVINNLDQTSGLINVSYSGDPERYVVSGTIKSHVENAMGPRDYEFPAASAHQVYEVVQNNNLWRYSRRMSLEGRANVVLEELGPEKTRVTANVRYILTKTLDVRHAVNGQGGTSVDTASFNSGQKGTFPKEPPPALEYYATGTLEQAILRSFQAD